ncbi:hypothetical protein C8F01DRAFT_1253167 [Mycena amicta]|nr:hypothetical protein C8F01DRAFT_1253167 [Mycena amicta]
MDKTIAPLDPIRVSTVSTITVMVEMNLEEDATGQGARTNGTWEVEVTQDMCNAFGTRHGACVDFLLDHATLGTMVFLG